MRIEDAKTEVIERISKIIGVRITENDLTFFQKQVVTSIAQTLRQIIILRQMLMIEKTKQSKIIFRIAKSLKRDEEDEVSKYIRQIDELQNLLNMKINEVANNILEQKKLSIMGEVEKVQQNMTIKVIQPLKCTNCGGRLRIVSYQLAECEYCGMKYTMSDYLRMLQSSIQNSK